MMKLREKDKRVLMEIFASVPAAFEVWAYGSRVTGEAHDGSDLDLVLRPAQGSVLSSKLVLELRGKIRESNLPISVDLSEWSQLPQRFHGSIEANHEVLFRNLEHVVSDDETSYEADAD
jgi:predicted nucleotidyltransferase